MTVNSGVPKSKEFICINCGHKLASLYKKYDNSIKAVNCYNCNQVADKYIEFEPFIVLIDASLLSQGSLRHVLFNRDFKLHWKLSLVLLLLESFALWRCRYEEEYREDQRDIVQEKGFYICCLQNIFDYGFHTVLLALLCFFLKFFSCYTFPNHDSCSAHFILLFKALALANFSKFFLLPILVWRQNTTDTGAYVHRLLVLIHHICSQICVFTVIVKGITKLKATLLIIPVFLLKEHIKNNSNDFFESFI